MTSEALRKKINALLNRTVARGCSEAEAMEAAAKAAALMKEHGLDETTISIMEKGVATRHASGSARARLWGVFASVTNTAAVVGALPTGREVSFVGAEPGPEIACYLFDVCNRAIDGEVKKFRNDTFYRRRRSAKTKRQAVDDFTIGLVMRIRARLIHMFRESVSEQMLLAARAELDRRYPQSRSLSRKEHKTRFGEASTQGWIAGGSIHLSHGVDQDGGQRLIGKAGAA